MQGLKLQGNSTECSEGWNLSCSGLLRRDKVLSLLFLVTEAGGSGWVPGLLHPAGSPLPSPQKETVQNVRVRVNEETQAQDVPLSSWAV